MKTRHDNDVTYRIGATYNKNDIELSWLIKSGVGYEKNKKGQLCD